MHTHQSHSSNFEPAIHTFKPHLRQSGGSPTREQVPQAAPQIADDQKTPEAFKFERGSTQLGHSAAYSIDNQKSHRLQSMIGQTHLMQSAQQAPQTQVQNDYLQKLLNDNRQLQTRLTLVQQDLERISKDKHASGQRLGLVQMEIEDYERALHDRDKSEIQFHGEIYDLREQNKKLQFKLTEYEHTRNGCFHELSLVQTDKERRAATNEDLSADLNQKVLCFNELSNNLAHFQALITQNQGSITLLENQIKDDHHRAHELAHVLDQLKGERGDLMGKLQQLQLKNDHDQRVLTNERQQIDLHNKRHQQLMSAKALFGAIEVLVRKKKHSALDEFFQYCRFDSNCHRTLRTLAGTLERVGTYHQRVAFFRWYQTLLQPLKTRRINFALAGRHYNMRLKQKTLRLWQEAMAHQLQASKGKDKSCRQTWALKKHDLKKEVTRVFTMMRDHQRMQKTRQRALYYLVNRQRVRQSVHALHTWNSMCKERDRLVRQYIIKQRACTRQLKMITLQQLRMRTKDRRAIRLMRLSHVLKAWHESHDYKKYMIGQNINLGHLSRNLKRFQLAQCFAAIRYSKENDKYEVIAQQLHQVVLPQIKQIEDQIEDYATQALFKHKLKQLRRVVKQTRCKMSSYFHHWRVIQMNTKHRIATHLRQIIKLLYRKQVHRAFNLWTNGDNWQLHAGQRRQIGCLHLTGRKTLMSVNDVNSLVTRETLRQQMLARIALVGASDVCLRRYKLWGLRKWNDRRLQLRRMEQAAGFILQKLRRTLCRQAFALYCQKCQLQVAQERAEDKCDYYLATRAFRRKRMIYNAFIKYTAHWNRAKENFGVLLHNSDLWMQRRMFFRWCDQGNTKTTQQKQACQNHNTHLFDKINEKLGGVVRKLTVATAENQEEHRKLIDQVRRVLANTFARFYHIKAERGFRKWFEFMESRRHRERLMKNTIVNWKRHRFDRVRAAFQCFVRLQVQQEIHASIKYTELKTEEQIVINENNRAKHEQLVSGLNTDIRKQKEKTNIALTKMFKLLRQTERRSEMNSNQSQLRYMFHQWYKFSRRQLWFIYQINRIMTKSIWQQGFTNISAFAHDKLLTRHQNRAMEGMSRMFFRKNTGTALSIWRYAMYNTEITEAQVAENTKRQEIKKQEKLVDKIKDWNGFNLSRMLRKITLQNHMRAWKNVHNWLMMAKTKTVANRDKTGTYYVRRALKKWHERSHLTKRYRQQMKIMRSQKRMIILKACYRQLKDRFYIEKSFMNGLSDFAAKFNNKQKQTALDMIKHFVLSREACNQQHKRIAAQNFSSILHQLYKRRMCSNYNYLRRQCITIKRSDFIIKTMIGQMQSRITRSFFQRWRENDLKQNCADEVNLVGPVVEDVLREQLRYQNSRYFLRDQAYTKPEVEQVAEWAKERALELLARSVSRLEHQQGEDRYLLPKMFDRWRLYIKMRKLVSYLIRNMENKLHPTKADLSIAFNRWRQDKKHLLVGYDTRDLTKLSENNHRMKQNLDQLEGQAQQYMNQLLHTRDELVDNLMGSQRLAIALGRDNLERGQQKALSEMSTHNHNLKSDNFQRILQQKVDLITQLKEKITDFENDNDGLAEENEELRQFSLDGYAIAKNVKELTREREKLSVDLSDKTDTIQTLLDENEALSRNLEALQHHAVGLIHNTQAKMNQMQAATGRY